MTKELQELIKKANETLSEAQAARTEVIDYLEEHYDITDISGYDYFEDECDWCYGLNVEKINMAIEQSK
jgi:hypothetical protein